MAILLRTDVPTPARRLRRLFIRLYILFAALPMCLGVVILGGGFDRFSTPGFQGPRDLVEWVPGVGGWAVWGLIFLMHGVTLIVAYGRSWAIHVLRFGLVLSLFWAFSLLKSVIDSPVAAATGVVVYTICGLVYLVLAADVDESGWVE